LYHKSYYTVVWVLIEIVYSIFIGMIASKIVGIIAGIIVGIGFGGAMGSWAKAESKKPNPRSRLLPQRLTGHQRSLPKELPRSPQPAAPQSERP
jgi:hypothetical protein